MNSELRKFSGILGCFDIQVLGVASNIGYLESTYYSRCISLRIYVQFKKDHYLIFEINLYTFSHYFVEYIEFCFLIPLQLILFTRLLNSIELDLQKIK